MEIVDQLWAKVSRAYKHGDEAERAIRSYFEDGGLAFELHGDHRTAIYEVRLKQHIEPPVDLALAYADELSNLRATLDHAVWHLAGSARHKDTAFPVVKHSKDWGSAEGSQLRGVPDPCKEIIKGFQPFQYEDTLGFVKHPACVLHELNNRSKHQLLVGLGVSHVDFRVGFRYSRPLRFDDLVIRDPIAIEGNRLVAGAVVLKVRLASKTKDLRIVDIHPEVMTDVGYGPRTDLAIMPFPNLPLFVGSVIDELAPYLRGHSEPPEAVLVGPRHKTVKG